MFFRGANYQFGGQKHASKRDLHQIIFLSDAPMKKVGEPFELSPMFVIQEARCLLHNRASILLMVVCTQDKSLIFKVAKLQKKIIYIIIKIKKETMIYGK